MISNKKTLIKISEAALNSCDPERAGKSLIRLFEQNPDIKFARPHLAITAKLFAASHFLANYCISRPDELYSAIKERHREITKRLLQARAKKELPSYHQTPALSGRQIDINQTMKALRIFKKRYLLRITIRDITGVSDIQTSMDELTLLSEVVINAALEHSIHYNYSKFGEPDNSTLTIIALGKLGGEELNYSSDVDLVAVYDNDEGQTTGILNPSGIMFNKISNHEFHCKTIELFSKILSSQTEDGIAYRVDLRLRPQGQKGEIALPLKAYKTYYESWGRTWERMALIRARPVAGNIDLGRAFLESIRPFVWRETLDYSEMEEIRGLKKRIDSTFSQDDIKRGYGGIREVEFFIQTFQLLYMAKNASLKSYRILNAIQALKWMKIIPDQDLTVLHDNYLYLRRVEQYIQMKEDLQTHNLPSSDHDVLALSRIMGFQSGDDFLANLQVRRMQIKNMYNSLLGSQEDIYTEALNLLEGGMKDYELTEYLSFRKVKRPEQSIINFNKIRDHMRVFHTMQERSISRKVIPQLLENALTAEDPDSAIAGIERLLTSFGMKTAHLSALMEQKELMAGVIKIFSLSPYLTRIFLSNQYYLNILIEEWSIFKTLKAIEDKLNKTIVKSEDFNSRLARFRRLEEVRLGMLFLQNIIDTKALFKDLSYLAEAIIKSILNNYDSRGLSVVALGKLGGREMTFGSDLDIIFISETPDAALAAETIMKSLTSYTDMGQLYSVDTRLRPDGSKGILVNDIDGYRNYYLNSARNWEIQALLKARPVGGDEQLGLTFINMAKDVILQKGGEIKKEEISTMRERIVKELSRETSGFDIKLGPGGIEEIEFFVQFLQLHHAGEFPDILVQSTPAAIRRLTRRGIINASESSTLSGAYEYFRKLETFQRLNEEHFITANSDFSELSARFAGHVNRNEFEATINKLRDGVLEIINSN